MNPIRQLRQHADITQQELAQIAQTSQSTIAAYESGAKSPTLRTMENLTHSLGFDLITSFAPRLTREDKRSLMFHRAIAKRLRQNPKLVLTQASKNLAKLMASHPDANVLLNEWRSWLKLPVEQLISNILDPGPHAREMRQVSPFSGLLSPKERTRILREFQKDNTP